MSRDLPLACCIKVAVAEHTDNSTNPNIEDRKFKSDEH